jgi:hypothetical protein
VKPKQFKPTVMKTKLLICLIAFIALTGCDKLKDATSITINTKLQSNIPVTIAGTKSLDEVTAVTFTKTQDLALADNTDIKSYLSKINEINLSNLVITFSGLTAGQTINSISLDVTGVGNVFTQTNITMSNNSFTPSVSSAILTQMGSKLATDKKLTLTVTGNTSGPMTFVVGCNMDAKVIVFTI